MLGPEEETPAVIIDSGSYMCKAGFSCDDAPRAVFPAIVSTPKVDATVVGSKYKDTYVGDEAQRKTEILSLRPPTELGVKTNWDDTEKIWHHVFYNELRTDPAKHAVIVTEPPLNHKGNTERIIRIMFDNIGVPALYVATDAVLAMYSSGHTAGVVLDSGDICSNIVPVHDGYAIPLAARSLDVAGKDLTRHLAKLMIERGYSFSTSSKMEIIRDVKEKLGYAAVDFKTAMQSVDEKSYELPDGTVVNVGNERFRCVEPLFQPSLLGKHTEGVHQLIYNSVMETDTELRQDIFSNVVLSGGSTLFPSFPDRLHRDLEQLVPSSFKVKVVAPPDRLYSVWFGGSLLASLSSFKTMWISKEEYDENGPSVIHQKCR